MLVKIILFSKKMLPENKISILFCLNEKNLVEIDISQQSVKDFAKENSFTRHEKFDWHINKDKNKVFLLEATTLNNYKSTQGVQWLTFPQAIKKLIDGKDRNHVQLAVQYISYGGIDESVIAADYDAEFLKELSKK